MTSTSLDVSDVTEPLSASTPPMLDLVVPVHNEALTLAPSIRRLHAFIATIPFHCGGVTIYDLGY
jgi:hypothetical protein